jgi:polyhydroxybutyrate depolymerase
MQVIINFLLLAILFFSCKKEAIDKWVKINGCNATPTVTDLPDIANDGTTIKQRIYAGKTNGSKVVNYVVLNGGHT